MEDYTVNCGCPQSPWVQSAEDYINLDATNTEEVVGVETLRFLLNGHCGIRNKVRIDQVVDHLVARGIPTTREAFQQGALGELKRRGIVATLVYPGASGGLFIPCDDSEIRQVSEQVFDRVIGELTNLRGMAVHTPNIQTAVDAALHEVQEQRARL